MKLGSITTIISGYAFRGGLSALAPGNKRLIRPSDLDDFDEDSLGKYKLDAPTISLRKNDILLSNKGKFRAALVNRVGEYVVPSSIFVLRLNDESICAPYLVAFVNSRHGQTALVQLASGSNIPALAKSTLEELNIPIIPKNEQMRVADITQRITEYRRLTNKKIGATEKLVDHLIRAGGAK